MEESVKAFWIGSTLHPEFPLNFNSNFMKFVKVFFGIRFYVPIIHVLTSLRDSLYVYV